MNNRTQVTSDEWRWVLVLSSVLILFLSIPYILGWSKSTPSMQFSGFLFGIEDMNSYLAKMRYGARDGWEFQLVYTSEPHQGGVAFVPFLALGKVVAAVTGEGPNVSAQALLIAYHVVRVPANIALLVTTYLFISRFISDRSGRRLAWLFSCALGGLGWVLLVFKPEAAILNGLPVEWYVPEAFSTLILYGLPHLALARSGLLLGWLWYFEAVERSSKRFALAAGVAWLTMGLCVPFFLALLGVIVAVWLAALMIVRRKLPGVELGYALAATALPLIYLTYNLWLFTTNPVFAIWSSQNVLPSPVLLDYVLAFGLLIGLAIPGMVAVGPLLPTDRRVVLLVTWILVAAVLAYSPINVQRRLLEGAIVPLSILASVGFAEVAKSWPPAARWIAQAAMIVLLIPSTLLLVIAGVATVLNPVWPVFHPADELAGLRWLQSNAPADSVVLSTRQSGMVLPAFSNVRTFVGHGPETVHAVEKEEAVRKLFATPGLYDGVVSEYGVDYIWISPRERELPCNSDLCSLSSVPQGYKRVFEHGDYTILEVVH